MEKFNSKIELFKHLKENKKEIVSLKKATIKKADSCFNHFVKLEKQEKSVKKKVADTDVITKLIIANTYNWLDSHEDVHINGCFAKSISERTNDVMHLHDHIYEIGAKVGIIKSLSEESINWGDLGISKEGMTQSLIAKTEIKKAYNTSIFEQYKDNEIKQHSVGMQYVKIELCINSTYIEYKEEYANWLKYSKDLGNLDKAEKLGYFWAILEAKLIEISAVIKGSNELTGIYEDKSTTTTIEPITSLENTTEPTNITQKINYNYIIDNFKL